MAKDCDFPRGQAAAAREAAAQARRQAEQIRVVRAKAQGAAPIECGPDVVKVAPARGRLISMKMRGMVPDPKDARGFTVQDVSYRGRRTIRSADVFDRMADQAKRANGRPIDVHLVDAGRAYRDLTERVACAGVKCSAIFDAVSGGSGGDFMDAFAHDVRCLKRMQAAIGEDVGLMIRRRRPSKRGGQADKRQNISDRMLVDMVCLADKSVSEVLSAYGWSDTGGNRKVLRGALCAILGRLRG